MNQPETGIPDLSVIRSRRGVSLRQIAEQTKIRVGYLEAIERGDLDKLPGDVYARSYVRQYARAIDFDEHDLLRLLNVRTETTPEPAAPPTLRQRIAGLLAPILQPRQANRHTS